MESGSNIYQTSPDFYSNVFWENTLNAIADTQKDLELLSLDDGKSILTSEENSVIHSLSYTIRKVETSKVQQLAKDHLLSSRMQACKNALQEVQFFSTRMEQLEFALEQPENDTFELVS